MLRVLVLYGTSEGHTASVARAIGDRFKLQGFHADVVDASTAADLAPDPYDGVIVAASVHIGSYQKPVRRWVRAHTAALDGRPNAFVSLCLGVLQHDPKVDADLAKIVDRFAMETGWRPKRVRILPGALLYRKYGLVTRWIMKRIAAKAGGDTDTSRDYDYTDWKQVDAFADEFAQCLVPAGTLTSVSERRRAS
jgi:menaquinone-dependent protoporphyrinogen oxidase